jgi:hypothetical protein
VSLRAIVNQYILDRSGEHGPQASRAGVHTQTGTFSMAWQTSSVMWNPTEEVPFWIAVMPMSVT